MVPPRGAVAAAPAPPNWQLVSGSIDGCSYYWDPSTVSAKGGYRKAWFMGSCPDPKDLGQGAFNTNKSTKFLLYFNCAEQTYMTTQMIFYSDQNGSGVVGTSTNTPVTAATFAEAAPNTTGADWVRRVCASKTPRP